MKKLTYTLLIYTIFLLPVMCHENIFERIGGEVGRPVNNHDRFFTIKLTSFEISRVSAPDICCCCAFCGHNIFTFGKEEGEVSIQFGSEKMQTNLFWSGRTGIPGAPLNFNYADYHGGILLYYKRMDQIPNKLDFTAFVTENDEEDKLKWEKAAKTINDIGTASSAVPVYGPAIGAGLGLVGSVVDLVGRSQQSTTELFYHGDFFAHGFIDGVNNFRLRHVSNDENEIVLNFRLECMNPVNPNAFPEAAGSLPIQEPPPDAQRQVRVTISNLEIHRDIANKIAKKSILQHIMCQPPKGLVVFEMNVGEQTTKHSMYPNVFKRNAFSLSGAEIYNGYWSPSGLPMSISLIRTEESDNFNNLIGSVASLIKATVPGADNDYIGSATTITQTLSSSLLSSVAPESTYTLFSLGKLLLRGSVQYVSFPMFSNKKGRYLGNIRAILNIEVYPIPAH